MLQVPGADFDIVDFGGTVAGLIAVLEEIADLPAPKGGPALIVIDSGSRVWETVGEEVRLAKTNRQGYDTDSDLWVDAKGDWQRLMNACRRHKGPVIITARMEQYVIHADGRPTREVGYRTKAEKNLAYDVDVIIELETRGEYKLTKAKSLALGFDGPRDLGPQFAFDQLWRDMGLDGKTSPRQYTVPVAQTADAADTSGRDWLAELAKCVSLEQTNALGRDAAAASASAEIRAAIRKKANALSPRTKTPAPAG